MSKHFQKISPIMKSDRMNNAKKTGISNAESSVLYEWGSKHRTHVNGPLFHQFNEAMQNVSYLAIQAINITNANNNQCIYMPNLHISRCNPLSDSDMQTSFSSTNALMRLIQQMAGIMPLTNTK